MSKWTTGCFYFVGTERNLRKIYIDMFCDGKEPKYEFDVVYDIVDVEYIPTIDEPEDKVKFYKDESTGLYYFSAHFETKNSLLNLCTMSWSHEYANLIKISREYNIIIDCMGQSADREVTERALIINGVVITKESMPYLEVFTDEEATWEDFIKKLPYKYHYDDLGNFLKNWDVSEQRLKELYDITIENGECWFNLGEYHEWNVSMEEYAKYLGIDT